jgi:hypothetical protein
MAKGFGLLLVLCALGAAVQAAEQQQQVAASAGANPVRRVVTMLQMMAKKVEAEGKEQDKMFEKFICYCDSNSGTLQKSIDDAKTKIPQVESDIKEAIGLKAQLDQELKAPRRTVSRSPTSTPSAVRSRRSRRGWPAASSRPPAPACCASWSSPTR